MSTANPYIEAETAAPVAEAAGGNPYLEPVSNPYLETTIGERAANAAAALPQGMATSVGASISGAARLADTVRSGSLLTQFAPGTARPTQSQRRRAYVDAMRDPRYASALMEAGEDPALLDKAESLFGPRAKLDILRAPIEAGRKSSAEESVAQQERMEESPTYQYGQDYSAAARRIYPTNPYLDTKIESKLTRAIGSTVPSVALGFVPGVGFPAAVSQYALSQSEDMAQEALDAGRPDLAMQSATAGLFIGAVSEATLGATARLKSLLANPTRLAALESWAKANPIKAATLVASVREGVQEGTEQGLGNVTASDLIGYDPDRPWHEHVLEATGLGAATGGLIGAGASTLNRNRRRQPAAPGAELATAQAEVDNALADLQTGPEMDPANAAPASVPLAPSVPSAPVQTSGAPAEEAPPKLTAEQIMSREATASMAELRAMKAAAKAAAAAAPAPAPAADLPAAPAAAASAPAPDIFEQTRLRMEEEARRLKEFKSKHGETTFDVPAESLDPSRAARIIISPEPGQEGRWRYTVVDNQGPSGHSVRDSWERAVSDAVRDYGIDLSKARLSQRQPAPSAPTKPPAAGGRRRATLGPRSDGQPDILDAIQQVGGIKAPGTQKGSAEYEGYAAAFNQGPAAVLRGGIHRPDLLLGELRSQLGYNFDNTDELYAAVLAAGAARDKLSQDERATRTARPEAIERVQALYDAALAGQPITTEQLAELEGSLTQKELKQLKAPLIKLRTLAEPAPSTYPEPTGTDPDWSVQERAEPAEFPADRKVTAAELPEAEDANRTTWYHGGRQEISTPSSSFSKIESLFGSGFYMTDDPAIAKSYARGPAGTLHQVKIRVRNVLNFEQPLPELAADALRKSVYPEFRSVVEGSLAAGDTGARLWSKLSEAVSEDSVGNMVPTSEYVEMFQTIEGNLREAGYDSITHIGGTRAGKGKKLHRVLILLDPSSEYSNTGHPTIETIAPVSDTRPSLQERPTLPSALDVVAADHYGAPYASLPAEQQRIVRTRLEEGSIRGRQSDPGTGRRQSATRGKPEPGATLERARQLASELQLAATAAPLAFEIPRLPDGRVDFRALTNEQIDALFAATERLPAALEAVRLFLNEGTVRYPTPGEIRQGNTQPRKAHAEELQRAQAELREAWHAFFKMGIMPNPEEDARKVYAFYRALFKLAMVYAKQGVKTAAEFAERAGLKLTAIVQAAWDDAKAGKPKGRPEDLDRASIDDLADGFRNRKFSIRFDADERVATEIREGTGNAEYQPIPNDLTVTEAFNVIQERGLDAAIALLKDERNRDLPDRVRVALGEAIITKANHEFAQTRQEMALDKAVDVAEWLTEYGTRLGQGVQAFAIWSRLTPDGYVRAYKRATMEADRKRAPKVPAPAAPAPGRASTPSTPSTPAAPVPVPPRPAAAPVTDPTVLGIAERIVQALEREAAAARQRLRAKLANLNIAADPSILADVAVIGAAKIGRGALSFSTWSAEMVADLGETVRPYLKQGWTAANALIDERVDRATTPANRAKVKAAVLKLPFAMPKSFDEETAKTIHRQASAALKLPAGFQRDQALMDVLAAISRAKGLNRFDMVIALWYANLLSGWTTQARNVVGNLSNLLAEFASHAAIRPLAVPGMLAGLYNGALRGAFDGAHILRTGKVTGTRVGKVEPPRALELIKFKGLAYPLNAWKYVFRVMAATDMTFFRSAEEMKTRFLGREIARREGHRGAALTRRMAEILHHTPAARAAAQRQAALEGLTGLTARRRAGEIIEQSRPEALVANVADYGRLATFNQEPEGVLGVFARGLRQMSGQFAPLRLVIPFTHVVANVTNNGLNFTPWGYRRLFPAFFLEQNWMDENAVPVDYQLQAARATLGTLGLSALYALAVGFKDEEDPKFTITANGPQDPRARNQLKETGWQPYSVRIGDRYYGYRETPLHLGFAYLGAMLDAQRYKNLDERDAMTRAAYGIQQIGTALLNQSFVKSLGEFFEGLAEDQVPRTAGRFNGLARTASGLVVPNLVKQLDRLMDPHLYNANTVAGALVRDVPAARRGLKPAVNLLGEPIRADHNPFYSVQRPDPVWTTLASKQAWISTPNRSMMIGERTITPDEYYDLVLESGRGIRRRLEILIPALEISSPERAQDMVQDVVDEERRRARAMIGIAR